MAMTNEKILENLDLYERKINIFLLVMNNSLAHRLYFSAESVQLGHLLEMIPQMRVFLNEGRREKVMRWLGFIQGALWSQNLFTLEDLKNHNRPNERKTGQEENHV